MSGRLKSNDILARNIEQKLKNQSKNLVTNISLAGETNLQFKGNLQSICDEAKSVLEAYLEACQVNGNAIAAFGDRWGVRR